MSQATLQTFVVHVEDLPGVLNRVSSLFRRRGYNIISLNVGRTHEEGISRMTVVVEGDDDEARRIEANLYKMVNVLQVHNITRVASIVRDLAMIKVAAGPEQRPRILEICEVFRARVVDVTTESMVVEITGTQEKIDGLVALLKEFGIDEMVQSGAVAMTRGSRSHAEVTVQSQLACARRFTAA